MDNRLYYRIGLLSAGALLLLVGVMFYLGLAEMFEPRIPLTTFFRESVQGLAVGSAVKYKGVPIGTVSSISIRTEAKLIKVDMQIDPKVFIDHRNPHIDEAVEVRNFCTEASRNGLCCRLDMAGITGMRYVEMDYFGGDNKLEPPPEMLAPDAIGFASVPSTMTNIVDTVATSLEKIAEVDFGGIGRSLEKNLNDLNTILGDPALKRSIDRVEKITANVEVTTKALSENLTGEDLRGVLKRLNSNLDSLSSVTSAMEKTLKNSNADEVIRKFGATADSVRTLSDNLNQTRRDFSWTLRQMNALMSSMSELVDYLRSDPNSLLRGKNLPPVSPETR